MPKFIALTVGDDGFLAFPPEILERRKVQIGDELFMTGTEQGYQITRHDPDAKGSANPATVEP